MGKEAGNRPGGDASQPIDFDISTVQALIASVPDTRRQPPGVQQPAHRQQPGRTPAHGQPPGPLRTPGREIQKHGPQQGTVLLDGERYRIRAGVQSIGGYSAHADQQGLVRFVKGIRRRPQDIRLVHGEEGAKRALMGELGRLCNWTIVR